MHSLITCDTQLPMPHHPLSRSHTHLPPSLIFEFSPKKRGRQQQHKAAVILGRYVDLTEVRSSPKLNLDSSWCCWCTPSEGDIELEQEIIDFMAKSEKPTVFPTKEDLIRAGRLDLVEAIKKRGGWFSLGWEDDNVEDDKKEVIKVIADIMESRRRGDGCEQSGCSDEHCIGTFSEDDSEDCSSSDLSSESGDLDSVQLAASSSMGGSLDIVADEDSGVHGILSRLEKQRNSDFGICLGKNGNETQSKSNGEGADRHSDTSSGFEGKTDLEEIGRVTPSYHHHTLDSSGSNIKHYTEPETWRTWSSQRAGFENTEFEAAEISFGKNRMDTSKEIYHDGKTVTTKEYADVWDQLKDINYNEIGTRLQHLESELNTTLLSLRVKREDSTSEEVTGSSSELSDALEFQENEIMSAKDRLRSIKAKLAVLEGKMALAIIEAQKTSDMEQKRMKASQKAFQLLRTTCIVWPNSASEVLLAGSFDGWTTQRRMQKSKYGVFSVTMKLYPGRYEIKFIVDGKWKVDPLRPIVNHGGYENNLFIVT